MPVVLEDRVEPDLVEKACRRLQANFSSTETVDMMIKAPGFTVRAEVEGEHGPGLHVLVVCKTLRDAARVFDFNEENS